MRYRNAESSYSLKELCREAGVTERTVRYYIQEGLLPPPEGAGPFARYSDQHLWRLRLIRRLKAEYLPLAEIRRRLEGLNPQDLEMLTEQTFDNVELDEEEADAKKYLDRLLSKKDASGDSLGEVSRKSSSQSQQWPVPPPVPAQMPTPSVSNPKPAAPVPSSIQAPGAATGSYPEANHGASIESSTKSLQVETAETEPQVWHRVVLGPGVELNYQLRDHVQRAQVNHLLEQARQIFNQ